MKIKSIYSIFFALIIFMSALVNEACAITPVKEQSLKEKVSVEAYDEEQEEADIIRKVSFRDKFRKSSESQINDFFKKYNRYSEKNDLEKLREMYDDNFVNNDGFNKETLFKMMEISADAYEDVEYTTIIDNIKVSGDFAVVDAHETAKGYTAAQIESLNDKGLITSEIYYTDYLKRDGNKWKITATDVRSELVSLKYGEAKNMPVEITAPECIASGTDYEVTLNTSAPLESFLVGSIVNEPIEFPVSQTRDVFRTIKSDELIRVLTSNSDNKNEYATVTIAVTRAKLEPPSVVINMTGMAFVMKRINVIKVNDQIKLEEINFNDKSET